MGEGWERVGEGWERVGRGLGEGWERVGRGWERVGRGLGEGWERVGRGLGEGWEGVGGGWEKVGFSAHRRRHFRRSCRPSKWRALDRSASDGQMPGYAAPARACRCGSGSAAPGAKQRPGLYASNSFESSPNGTPILRANSVESFGGVAVWGVCSASGVDGVCVFGGKGQWVSGTGHMEADGWPEHCCGGGPPGMQYKGRRLGGGPRGG